MKVLGILLVFCCCVQLSHAQHLKVPELSPSSKLEQKVGLTNILIEYSRPGVKGRSIFGDLVPFGELWRTGANVNTTITFSDDVRWNGKDVKKGAYAIFTIPGVNNWEVILYDAPHGFAPNEEDDDKVIARFEVPVKNSPTHIETFTIDISDIETSSAIVNIRWAEVFIQIPFTVPGDAMAMENIQKLIAGPSADDLFNAAEYYYHNDKDLDLALEWTRLSAEKYTWDAYWPHLLEARILHKQKKTSEAIIAGERAASFVRKAGYLVVAKQIDDQVVEWKEGK